jgi:hypothetical protein
MCETVDATQERLSPQNLKEQTKDRLKEATVGRAREARSGIVETVRANPLPAALTGIGWLLVSAPARPGATALPGRRRLPRAHQRLHAPVADKYRPQGDTGGTSAGETLGRARDKVGETAIHAQDKAEDLADRAQGKASDLGSRTRDRASQLKARPGSRPAGQAAGSSGCSTRTP